jgi:hypothetical protein
LRPADPVAALRAQGFVRVQELSHRAPDGRLMRALLLEEGEGATRHRAVVVVLGGPAGTSGRPVYQVEHAWARLVSLGDVDRDGTLDLVVRAGNGGACWTCSWIEAVSLPASGSPSPMVPPQTFQSLDDLDGDGVPEGIQVEDGWEVYEGLPRSCSPRVDRIFQRVRGSWVEASRRFPGYYRQNVAELEKTLGQPPAGGDEPDDRELGGLISLLLNRRKLGEEATAWAAFEARIAARLAGLSAEEGETRTRIESLVAALQRDLRLRP